jgi:4-hydroxy-2-oxoheptanedioate aldolase
MNKMEKQMVGALKELKEKFSVTGVKMEFEAEGTRMEEAMRLKEISLKAGVDLTVKIGGCEAIKDMFEASSLGTDHLVGPMVESQYALKKYLAAVRTAFTPEQRSDMEFFVNIETITAVENFEKMLQLPEINELSGVVLGRVDLSGSMNLNRDSVNGKEVFDHCLKVAKLAKAHGKKVVVGGAVSVHSMAFFKDFPKGHLDRYETRKVVFSCPGALSNSEEAFIKAVEFEILWLQNKKAHYGLIHREDDSRLVMMTERYNKSIETFRATKG